MAIWPPLEGREWVSAVFAMNYVTLCIWYFVLAGFLFEWFVSRGAPIRPIVHETRRSEAWNDSRHLRRRTFLFLSTFFLMKRPKRTRSLRDTNGLTPRRSMGLLCLFFWIKSKKFPAHLPWPIGGKWRSMVIVREWMNVAAHSCQIWGIFSHVPPGGLHVLFIFFLNCSQEINYRAVCTCRTFACGRTFSPPFWSG